jgi:integrase
MKNQKSKRPLEPRTTEALTIKQVKALLAAADGEMKTLILLTVRTGRRLCDLMRFRWKDVDLAKRLICFHVGKTDRTVVIPMTPDAVAHLAKLPKGGPDAPVLPGIGSRPTSAVSRMFGVLAKQVGIEGANFYSLRVTFISQLQDACSTPLDLLAILSLAKTPSSPNKFSLADLIAKLPPLK